MKQIFKSTLLILAIILPLLTSAQDKPIINATISGKVVDSRTNDLIIGASVVIKGTTNGASTDANGEFSLITGQKLPFTLVISYVGYQKKEVVINTNKVEISIEESTNELSDVVVTSRRRQESIQDIPIPIAVISGAKAEDAGAFNPNRLKELIPSVQLYSSMVGIQH